MRRDTRSRAQRIREAILRDLEATDGPLTLGEMKLAAAEAHGNRAEVYWNARKLAERGALIREGAGYHHGETHTYELAPSWAERAEGDRA